MASFDTDTYKWKNILLIIYSQTFHPKTGEKKAQKFDEAYGNMDVDAIELKKIFKDRFMECFHLEYFHDQPFKDFISGCIQVMNPDEKKYDCFFFAFLTFSDTGDERLHFANDNTGSENLISLEHVIEEVKKQKVTWGNPKIFLLLADDMSSVAKGNEEEKGEKVKIPQDADRLIITSYIPQKVANNDSQKNNSVDMGKPSFLIQAFKGALQEEERNDLLTLTTMINRRMADMLQEYKMPKESNNQNMPVSLVTSTLTKLLYL